jgi:GLPGLI family protein
MKFTTMIFTSALLALSTLLYAQNKHFTTNGAIEYDKTVNMFAILKKQITKDNETYMQPAYDKYIKEKPQFIKLKSTLTFTNGQTLFTPMEDPENSGGFIDNPLVSQNSIIFSDIRPGICTAQKKVFDETFLLKDSLRKIKWKITDERREIAGYNCRRANGLILDTIYVVAFYTDEIPVSGGPESFNGLPGMILGVALPHENVTWFATKITDELIQPNAIKPPVKGKPVNNKTFRETLLGFLKSWGNYGQSYLKGFML